MNSIVGRYLSGVMLTANYWALAVVLVMLHF